ncbi:hypothetical protein QUF63_02000 [Anaerolineales bacterium HSG25]|nr:hypothetical protein [Anaerolineales bacterium HSG25]
MADLADAIEYIRLGNREEGREILEEVLEEDENNDAGWLWMSAVVEDDEERQICLENVVAINPDNDVAQRALQAMEDGSFSLNDMLSDALETYEGLPDDDDNEDDEFDDDELELPSTMKKKKSGGLNPRLIIGIIFGLLIVCGLGGTAIYNLVLSDDGGGDTPAPTTQPAEEGTPAPDDATEDPTSEQPVEEATATPAPTSTDTPIPTPSNVPFELPTAIPTDAPTPIATQVVPPTPS